MGGKSTDTKRRAGAQCVKLICAEPATNTQGAQQRLDDFIRPLLEGAGVQIDEGRNGRLRYLKDRLQLPGIVRRYVTNYRGCWQDAVINDSLDLLYPTHRLELAVIIDHTNCAERQNAFFQEHGRHMLITEESVLIRQDLECAEQLIRAWHASRQDTGKFVVVKAVGLVTDSPLACERRLEDIVLLDHYIQHFRIVENTTL